MSRVRTVLLVDDDPDLRDTVELLLLRRGYHVVATGNGVRAVELADAHRVDVALVDLLIPGQSGFRVMSELKARHGDAIRVVVTSGTGSAAHRDYAFAAGADYFLPKPFDPAELVAAVAALCPPPDDRPASGSYRTARIGA